MTTPMPDTPTVSVEECIQWLNRPEMHTDRAYANFAASHLRSLVEENKRIKAENEALASEKEDYKYDLNKTEERLKDCLDQLRCPECGCGDIVDALSNECGCDAPICARDNSETLAEWALSLKARLDAADGEKADIWKAAQIVAECDAFLYDRDEVFFEGPSIGKFRVALNMGDTFAWACADAEILDPKDYDEVLRVYEEHGHDGLTAWVAIRRGQEPIEPVAKKEGYQKARAALAGGTK